MHAVRPWFLALSLAALGPTIGSSRAAPPALTDAEQAAGWRWLFDGESTTGWRSFSHDGFPRQGWTVKDGCLTHSGRGGGGDIITEATFADFELTLEWRMAPNGNSGIKYFVTRDRGGAIGHEYQLLTGRTVEAEQAPSKGGTAGFYDVLPPIIPIRLRPADQFNESRIVVRGNQAEHWLNGALTIRYELGSPEVLAAVANSKFKDVRAFGTKVRGHLLLQDHGGEIWFRNLKIREFAE